MQSGTKSWQIWDHTLFGCDRSRGFKLWQAILPCSQTTGRSKTEPWVHTLSNWRRTICSFHGGITRSSVLWTSTEVFSVSDGVCDTNVLSWFRGVWIWGSECELWINWLVMCAVLNTFNQNAFHCCYFIFNYVEQWEIIYGVQHPKDYSWSSLSQHVLIAILVCLRCFALISVGYLLFPLLFFSHLKMSSNDFLQYLRKADTFMGPHPEG